MAIVFDDKYHKIIKSTVDFENDTTEVEMRVYASQYTREREKQLKESAIEFCQRVQDFLVDNMQNLINETNLIQPIETIYNGDEFLAIYPEIKIKADEQESIQKEGLYLVDKILKENINLGSLKHLDKWIALGLTEMLCYKIDILGTMNISLEGKRDNNLAELYFGVKENIVSPVIDC